MGSLSPGGIEFGWAHYPLVVLSLDRFTTPGGIEFGWIHYPRWYRVWVGSLPQAVLSSGG